MKERPRGENELASRYPELDQAREMLVKVFGHSDVLKKLGYRRDQIDYARPALSLISGEGRVATIATRPYLCFEDSEESNLAEICGSLNKKGYILTAIRDKIERALEEGLGPEERLLGTVFGQKTRDRVIIFADMPIQVAHIGLFRENDAFVLDNLVISLCSDAFDSVQYGLKRESPLTKAMTLAGLKVGTYEADWVDTEKTEFVARLKRPEEKPFYVGYRRLETREGFVPFGKVANMPQENGIRIRRKERHPVMMTRRGLVGIRIW